MSQSTNSVPSVNVPVQVPETPVSVPVPDTTVPVTTPDNSPSEAELMREANGILDRATLAYANGEQSYSVGMLDSGRLDGQYVKFRMENLGHERAACLRAIVGDLNRVSSKAMDEGEVNRLIRTYAAFRLLENHDSTQPVLDGDVKGLPAYSHYREHYSMLTERTNKDTPQEGHGLLPGMEAECKALYAECKRLTAERGITVNGIANRVKAVLLTYAKRQQDAAVKAERERLAAKAQADTAANEAEDTKQATAAEVKRLEEQAKTAVTAEDKAAMTQAAEEARERDRQAQQEHAEKVRKAAEEDRLARQAQADKEAKVKAAAKAQADKDKADGKDTPKQPGKGRKGGDTTTPPTPAATPVTPVNLLKVSEMSTAKDTAGMMVELLAGKEKEQAGTWNAFLELLATDKRIDKAVRNEVAELLGDSVVAA